MWVSEHEVVVDIFWWNVLIRENAILPQKWFADSTDRRARPEYTIKLNLQMAETQLEAELEAENNQVFYSTLSKTGGPEYREKSRYEQC